MTKEEYNQKPTSITEAEDIIKAMAKDIDALDTELNQKYQQLLQTNPNAIPLTPEQIITQAKDLGMKTKEDYQTALAKQQDTPTEPENISPL
jgi:predicted ATP-dependent endonuclease of OLD family